MVQAQWNASLPVRLREMHSYWLCRERGVLVLRGVSFRKRDISFLVLVNSGGANNSVRAANLKLPEGSLNILLPLECSLNVLQVSSSECSPSVPRLNVP
jgi:hypothetical protein